MCTKEKMSYYYSDVTDDRVINIHIFTIQSEEEKKTQADYVLPL